MYNNRPEEIFAKFTTEEDENSGKERTYVEIYNNPDSITFRSMPSVKFYTDSIEIKVKVRNRKGYGRELLETDMEFVKKALDVAEKLLDADN